MFSLDRSKNDTSVTLDLLRAVAAQMVCVGHAINFFLGGWPATLPYMQNIGVLLFFIISGFLITHTLIERSRKPEYGFPQFFIDRLARIYSGLIPALILIVIVDGITIHLTGDETIARSYNFKTLIANLFMLESYRGIYQSLLRWSTFGSASPLWTLAIEWHIYMFAGALFFMARRPRSILFLIPVALFFGQTALHFLFGVFQPDGVGRGLFSLWLGGAAVYLLSRAIRLPWPAAIAAAIATPIAFVIVTPARAEYGMLGYPLLIAAVLGLVSLTQGTHVIRDRGPQKAISFFADYSFTLYLVHHTVMYAMWTIWPDHRGVLMFSVAVLASNLIAVGLAEIGEKHYRRIAILLRASWRPVGPTRTRVG
jgi:peptidoglycan/LPS O-acetylase OafA/YrhL